MKLYRIEIGTMNRHTTFKLRANNLKEASKKAIALYRATAGPLQKGDRVFTEVVHGDEKLIQYVG